MYATVHGAKVVWDFDDNLLKAGVEPAVPTNNIHQVWYGAHNCHVYSAPAPHQSLANHDPDVDGIDRIGA